MLSKNKDLEYYNDEKKQFIDEWFDPNAEDKLGNFQGAGLYASWELNPKTSKCKRHA